MAEVKPSHSIIGTTLAKDVYNELRPASIARRGSSSSE